MAKNLLLEYSEELATKCELLCKSISGNSNTVFQLRKSSSSVFANITEALLAEERESLIKRSRRAVVGHAPETVEQVVAREYPAGIFRRMR